MSERDGFLRRWSRRKREAVEPEGETAATFQTAAVPAGEALTPPAEADEPPFDLTSLPAIEELDAASDISAFLQKGVPEALKNAALRRIWAADPAIRDYIGPVDYGWDFNAPETIPGFGALEAGFDVEAAARRIAGLAEPVSAADEEPEAPAEPAGEALEAPIADVAVEAPAALDLQSGAGMPASEETLPLRRRRHGGALPTN